MTGAETAAWNPPQEATEGTQERLTPVPAPLPTPQPATGPSTAPQPVAFTPTAADMLGAWKGIAGTAIGEDADRWLLLGHVEARRAIVAICKIGRLELGLNGEDVIGWTNTVQDAVGQVEHTWAVFIRHPDGCQCAAGDDDWGPCEALVDGEPVDWWCEFDVTEGTPGAVPVTVYVP